MLTELQYALSWRKEATGRLVNFAAPGTQVRPEARFILGGEPPQSFVVKRTYESIIRWIIKRLSPGSGRPLETFLAVRDGPGRYIAEEPWTVPPPSRKPDLFVFYDDRSRQSGELKTANPVSVQTRLHPNLGAGLSSSGLLPTPFDAQAGVDYEKQLAYELYAVADPALRLRVLAPGLSGEDDIRPYLDAYLTEVAAEQDLSPGPLARTAYEFLEPYLEGGPVLGAEPFPFELELAEGERHTAFLRLFPHTSGRTVLAVRATDADGRPLATSELIGLSLEDDGLLYRDF